ncbi:unknown [Clostridium sp. CAG:508]|nr:unknown [Clostridium sp. CAG:508]
MNLKEFKQVKSKGGDKKTMKTKIKQEKGITLIALVVTIVVLLILAGVSVNALFGNSGIIEKAKEAQNAMTKAKENDEKQIGELTNWLDNQVNGTTGGGTTGGDDNQSTTPKISTLVGTVVDKNTKAEDAYGNKIIIPKGFKILSHGTAAGSATYMYSGDSVPAVQDGIVIENGTDGNQFVWVPVGTIKNKNNTTNTITLGRYEFDSNTGALKSNTPAQVASVENCTQEVVISNSCKELSVFRAGNTATDSTAQNATARNLKEFISTTLSNGGYYIARFEASGTASKITSKYNQKVLVDITQPNAAKLAREMYEEVKENNELVYASDLVNSYAWDTAIVFIQTYSVKTDYASHNESNTTKAFTATGKNNDKYCNIFDMSGNASEWTTEYSTDSYIINSPPCVIRGGCYNPANGSGHYTSSRSGSNPTSSYSNTGLRPLLYVK